jgi:hypothetical protein
VATAPNTAPPAASQPTPLSLAAEHVAGELRGLADDEVYACVIPAQDQRHRALAIKRFGEIAEELRAVGLAGDAGARHLPSGVVLWLAALQEDPCP